MAEKTQLSIAVIDPDKILFKGKADFVIAPGVEHTLGILPGHTPMYAELIEGEIYIGGEQEQIVPLVEGILKVRADEVTVLVISKHEAVDKG